MSGLTLDPDRAPTSAIVGAATASALFTTAVTYPLDLAHGRMAADMSKKPPLVKDSRGAGAGTKGNKKTLSMQQ